MGFTHGYSCLIPFGINKNRLATSSAEDNRPQRHNPEISLIIDNLPKLIPDSRYSGKTWFLHNVIRTFIANAITPISVTYYVLMRCLILIQFMNNQSRTKFRFEPCCFWRHNISAVGYVYELLH